MLNGRDINFKDKFCALASILVIIPPYTYLVKDEASRKNNWYRWYAIIILLVLILGNALSVWGRFMDAYPLLPSYTLVTTDLALNISMIATNIFAVLMPSFFQVENFKSFMNIFTKSDTHLNKNFESEKTKKCKLFYVELLVGNVILLGIFIYDGFVWVRAMGFVIYRHYIFRNLQSYQSFMTVMVMYNFALCLKYRFKELNHMLQKVLSFTELRNDNSEPCLQFNKCEFHKTVRQISQLYEKEIMQINLFNAIFGWQILFLTLSIMMGLLNALDIIIVVFTQNGTENTFGIDLVILSSICSFWQLGLGIITTVSCKKASEEAQRMADICFNILLRLPTIPETKQERALRDELTLLTQLSINRCPAFSAVGFFSIDYNLLLALLGSVTSYVIVLIQFNK